MSKKRLSTTAIILIAVAILIILGSVITGYVSFITGNAPQNSPNPKQCSDGIDNDGDGLIDFPEDPGCRNSRDNDERDDDGGGGGGGNTRECRDGRDNDGDGKIDWPADSGCDSKNDRDESNCGDGVCEGGETNATCNQDCAPEPPTCSSAFDCSPGIQLRCQGDSSCTTTTNYICQNPGSPDSNCVFNNETTICTDCQFGCLNGECLLPTEFHMICNNNSQCVSVGGPGDDQCAIDLDCTPDINGPDLIVLSISILNNMTGNETDNQTSTIFATISNIGNSGAGSSITMFLVTPQGGFHLRSTSSIPAGGSKIVSVPISLDDGSYVANVTADWFDVVDELDENNNDMSQPFTVP